MTKIIKTLLFLPLLFSLSSCYWDQEVPISDKTELSISKEGTSIEKNDDSTLDVRAINGAIKNVKWSSSDDSVVKVINTESAVVIEDESEYKVSRATLRGMHEGSATVTATLKTKIVSCLVVVKDSLEMPVLHVSNTDCSMFVDDSFNFTSYVTYHNRSYTCDENGEDFIYSFTPIDEDKNNIVEFEATDKGFKAIGLNYGNTTYTVSTELFGLTCSTLINVKVKNNKNFIDIENATPIDDGFEVNLTTINDDLNIDNIVLRCNVINTDGTAVNEPVTLTSANPEIVKVSANKLEALKVGNAIVKATSPSASVDIKVNVIKPTYATCLTDTIIDISEAKDSLVKTLNFVNTTVYGDGVSLTINGSNNVLKNVANQNVNLDYNLLTQLKVANMGDSCHLVLETSRAFYTFDASVYSMVIDTKEEVNSWQDEADKYNGLDYASSGYFVLGNNISMGTTTSEVHWNRSVKEITDGTNATNGFHGIFDGKGYYIDGYRPTGYGSFITLLASDGIIRNVGFTNITVKGSETGDSKQRCVMLCAGSGLVQNVYLGYKTVKFTQTDYAMERCSMFSGTGPVNAGKGQIESVFVEAPTYGTTNYSGFYDLMGKADAAKGFYGVGGIHLGRYYLKRDPSDGYSVEYPYQYWGTGSYYGTFVYLNDNDVEEQTFTNKDTLKNNQTVMSELKELFGNTYWDYSTGIPQWKSYINGK